MGSITYREHMDWAVLAVKQGGGGLRGVPYRAWGGGFATGGPLGDTPFPPPWGNLQPHSCVPRLVSVAWC